MKKNKAIHTLSISIPECCAQDSLNFSTIRLESRDNIRMFIMFFKKILGYHELSRDSWINKY